jgi:Ca-activated chloride channel family protein
LLESTAAPLVRSTASFDALRWRLHAEQAARQSPRRKDAQDVLSSASIRIRTEEFLAAMRYDFPPPTSSALAIRTSAGPSPFAAPNVRLLQVGVQSMTLASSSRSPVELTIAVDVSSRMGADGRLEIVRQALVDLLDRLRPDDRVTLVASGSAENVIAERVTASNPVLRRAIARLAVEPQTTLPSVITRAVSMARATSAADMESTPRRRQIIVFADAPTFLTSAQRSESRRMLMSAAADNIAAAVVDLSQAAVADSDLARLADSADAEFDVVSSTAGATRALDKALFARSTAVANGAELSIRFNPRSVASYRLVGHEATLGLPTAPAKISLRSGEAAAALFEIVLRDDGTNDVGTAELEWTDPETGAKQLLTQPISRVQFANSLAESSISLQAAAVAAETAEILRGARANSPSGEHSLDRVLEVVRAVHPRLRDQAEFRSLVEVIEMARQSGLSSSAP